MTGWLPKQGLLLHIGPHKTGTTAIQGALQAARPELARRGVIYPGSGRQQRMPALAITNSHGVSGMREARMVEWERLVADVYAARRKRVVVSSESFVEADDATAATIVEQLGGDRVHVAVTLRPLARILPSAWQQLVRNHLRVPYDEWLDAILSGAPDRVSRNFWHRHRHEAVIERWISIVGEDRVAVVVADDVDRSVLPRSIEHLLGLPDGFLVTPDVRDNRGLTQAETELIRQLNVEFEERGWSETLYNHVVREGVVMRMQSRTPEADEPRITTPAWAVDEANQIARFAAKRIRDFGVLVLGDLDSLSAVPANPTAGDAGRLADEAARAALAGVRDQLEELRSPREPVGTARPVEMIATRELTGIVGRRVTRRISARLGLGIKRH